VFVYVHCWKDLEILTIERSSSASCDSLSDIQLSVSHNVMSRDAHISKCASPSEQATHLSTVPFVRSITRVGVMLSVSLYGGIGC
jgi:hypothetical protein